MIARASILPLVVVAAVGAAAVAFVVSSKRDNSGGGSVEEFSGSRAFAHVEQLVALGPRHPGTPAAEAARRYIEAQLAASGWELSRQTFTDMTPRGEVVFVNLRARRSADGTPIDWDDGAGMVLLCSHYDTKIFDDIDFDGANDGGSSTGVLLEMGRCLAADPKFAAGVELVFFDGEEAVVEFTPVDGLYGSRHFAKGWRSAPPESKPRAAFVLDLVGDRPAQRLATPPASRPLPRRRGGRRAPTLRHVWRTDHRRPRAAQRRRYPGAERHRLRLHQPRPLAYCGRRP